MLPLKPACAGFFCALLLSIPARARPAVQLDYARKAGAARCPDEQAFIDVLAARLGFDPVHQSASYRLVVTITLRPGRGYEGKAELRDGDAVRWTEPVGRFLRCVSVVRALGLAVAVRLQASLEPDAPAAGAPVEPAATRKKSAIIEKEPGATRPAGAAEGAPPAAGPAGSDRASAASEPRRKLYVGVTSGLAIASVPGDTAAELAADAGIVLRRFALSGELRWTAPNAGAEAKGTRFLGGIAACGHWPIKASVEFFACGAGQAGMFFGSGIGLARLDTAVLPYAGLGTRARFEMTLMPRWLALRVGGDAMLAAIRPRLAVSKQPVWVAPIVSGVVEGGLVLLL